MRCTYQKPTYTLNYLDSYVPESRSGSDTCNGCSSLGDKGRDFCKDLERSGPLQKK